MSFYRPFDWRIGVGDPNGLHSEVWKIWAAKKTADVYITVPSHGGDMKVSIHASGARHEGLTAELHRKEVAKGTWTAPSRHYAQWEGGAPVLDGLNLEYVLRFPASELRSFALRDKDKLATWIQASQADQTLEVGVFFANQSMNLKLDSSAGHQAIATGHLSDGTPVALITLVTRRGPPDNMAKLTREIAESCARTGLTPETVTGDTRVVAGFHLGKVRGSVKYALDTFLKRTECQS